VTDAQVFFGLFVASFALSILIIAIGVPLFIRRKGPVGMLRRIRKTGQLKVSLRNITKVTWNPARSWTTDGLLHGPGEGHYWIGDDAQVHLRWVPRGGRAQEFVGPLPVGGTTNRQMTWLYALYLMAYLVAGGGGFTAGFFATPHEDRLTAALWFALVAMFAVWLVSHVTVAVLKGRGSRH
jgi:hypothetical protein